MNQYDERTSQSELAYHDNSPNRKHERRVFVWLIGKDLRVLLASSRLLRSRRERSVRTSSEGKRWREEIAIDKLNYECKNAGTSEVSRQECLYLAHRVCVQPILRKTASLALLIDS